MTQARGPSLEAAWVWWRRLAFAPSRGRRSAIYEQLASTLRSGLGIAEALRVVAERNRGRAQLLLRVLAEGVGRGDGPASAMRDHPELFDPLEPPLVAAAERTGRFDEAFSQAARHVEAARRARLRVIGAVLYPVVLVHVAFLLTLPVALGLDVGYVRGLVTSTFLLAGLWLALAAALTAHAALSPSPAYGRLLATLPVVGPPVRAAALARLCRAFAALHDAGVPAREALAEAARAAGNAWAEADVARASERVAAGETVADALRGVEALPPEAWSQVATGEESGELDAAFLRVAELAEERYDTRLQRVTVLLPVLLVLLVGALVLWMAVSVVGRYWSMLPR